MVASARGHSTPLNVTSRKSVTTGAVAFANRQSDIESSAANTPSSPSRQVEGTSGYVESSETREWQHDGVAARRDSHHAELRPMSPSVSANVTTLKSTSRYRSISPSPTSQPACANEGAQNSSELFAILQHLRDENAELRKKVDVLHAQLQDVLCLQSKAPDKKQCDSEFRLIRVLAESDSVAILTKLLEQDQYHQRRDQQLDERFDAIGQEFQALGNELRAGLARQRLADHRDRRWGGKAGKAQPRESPFGRCPLTRREMPRELTAAEHDFIVSDSQHNLLGTANEPGISSAECTRRVAADAQAARDKRAGTPWEAGIPEDERRKRMEAVIRASAEADAAEDRANEIKRVNAAAAEADYAGHLFITLPPRLQTIGGKPIPSPHMYCRGSAYPTPALESYWWTDEDSNDQPMQRQSPEMQQLLTDERCAARKASDVRLHEARAAADAAGVQLIECETLLELPYGYHFETRRYMECAREKAAHDPACKLSTYSARRPAFQRHERRDARFAAVVANAIAACKAAAQKDDSSHPSGGDDAATPSESTGEIDLSSVDVDLSRDMHDVLWKLHTSQMPITINVVRELRTLHLVPIDLRAHHERMANYNNLDLEDPINKDNAIDKYLDGFIADERAVRNRWRGRPAPSSCPDIGSPEARASKRVRKTSSDGA